MKGARRVKRRTADRHPDVVLAGRLSQSFHQAGLADPGLALDQHDLAAAVATAVPGPQQQPHLLLAPDEGCRAPRAPPLPPPGPGCGKPALDIPRRQDAPGRHRLGEPLQLRCPQILEVEVIAEHRARGRADDDLVRLRQCLQTRRQVRRLADDRGFRCRSFADLVADDHRSGGDADPHRELDPGRPRDRGIQLRHRIDDVETRPHRTLGLVLMGARVAEIDEDAVAHVLRDKAVVTPDRGTAPALIRRDDIAQIFGVHPGRECRRSHQVAKHHGQLAALGLRRPRRPRPARRNRRRRAIGFSACRKAGNGCGSAMGSGRAARPSGAQTRSSPSTSAATRLMTISSRRSSSRPSSSRPKAELDTAIGDAALGDEAPEDLLQDLLKVHASAPVRRDLRPCSRIVALAPKAPEPASKVVADRTAT